ncbi:MAG: type I-E CRISPR-associated protein Cse1/CasA [Actinomycetales bacterium]|nr:type I-E CRISPR-associated protein Cse1/CasA [Actinomycetales bacterium]
MSIANATKTAASTSLLEDATHVPKKFGNIRDLEWLPVVDSNGRRMVGLDELFTSAHLIKSIDVRAPIERAGVLRFLTTVTALVAREQGVTTASAADVARTGFDDGAVRRALDAIDDRLWLIHPDTPFMQEGRYATATSATKNAESIRSTSPGDSSKAWWGRAGDGFATGHLKVTDAPATLAGFWFYSTNNNGKVTLTEGSVAQQGSAAGKVVAAGIRLWKTGTSLAQTLLFNTPEAWIKGTELPAWAQTLSGSGSLDPFVTATITGNATLLLPEWVDGQLTFTSAHVGGVLRKGIPAPADAPKDSSPTALDALKASLLYAWHADPQVVFRKQDPKKKELVGLEKVRALNDMSAGTSTLHNLNAWYLRAFNPDVPSSSILVSETFTIELFSLQLAQKGSYGEISGASWLSMPTGTVGGSPEAQEALRVFAEYAYGHVRRGLYLAVRDVLGDDDATDSTFENALSVFTSRSERVVEDVIALATKGETFTIEHVKRWVRSAMDAFDEALTPFSNARTISDIARARQNLFHRINQTESD